MDCKAFALVLFALSSASAFYTLIPEGKELVYHYHASVGAGTHIPDVYASSFVIDGDLHVQTDKNSSYMKFTDLKFKMQNGEYDQHHEFEAKYLDLPKNMEDLEKVFKVVYDESGKGMGIAVDSEEKHFVTNMKKAIANIMQLDMEQVHIDSVKPHAFHTKEHTMYGLAKTYYNVQPHKDYLMVEKMLEYKTTRFMHQFLFTNAEFDYCKARYHEPLSYDSQRKYQIVKKDNEHVVDTVEATGGIYYTPMQGDSIAYTIYMNQTLELKTVDAVKTKLEATNQKYIEGFKYMMADFTNMETLPDITNGLAHWDMEKLMPMVKTSMQDMISYMHEDHIHTKQPDYKKGHVVSHIISMMKLFDLPTFEKFHEALIQKTTEQDKMMLEVYYNLLPTIGTHASMKHIKNLVHDVKVKEHMAIKMLKDMPFHVKFPTEKFVKEMEDMIHWGNEITWTVRKAAVLSFATLLHKAVHKHDRVTDYDNMWHGVEHYSEKFQIDYKEFESNYFPKQKAYEKYIVEFINKLKAAKDLDTKILYLNALYNTKMESVMHHLIPAVKGEWWDDNFLRMIAAYVVFPSVAKHEELVYELYWPIMTDQKLPTTLRVVALYLMMETQPTMSRLINIYWHMQGEQNHALYQFWYTYMESWADSTDPCTEMFQIRIKQVLAYTLKPEFYSMTGYHAMDYTDMKYDFGVMLNYFYVHNTPQETERMFVVNYSRNVMNLQTTPCTVFVRVEGMDNGLFEDFKLDITNAAKLFNYEEIMKMVQDIPKMKDMVITIIIQEQSQIVMYYHCDSNNMNDLTSFFDFIWGSKFSTVKKFIDISMMYSNTILLPTEMGLPAMFEFVIPSVTLYDVNMNKDTANKMITFQIDNHMKQWIHHQASLKFYNPMADVWQGVMDLACYDSVLPMYFDVAFNPQQQSMKISFKRHEDTEKDVVGIRSHAATAVFVKDLYKNGDLKKTSPDSNEYELVTYGDEYRHNYTLYHKEDLTTGYDYTVAAYDTERSYSKHSLYQYWNAMSMPWNKNFATSFGQFIMTKLNMHDRLFYQAAPLTNGFMYRYEPSKKYPVTNIDITLRLNREYKTTEWMILPGIKYNARMTYAIKNKETNLKTWDANVMGDVLPGHNQVTMKVQLTRIIPGKKDFMMCLDGTNKWTLDTVTGHWNFAMSQAVDGKCSKDEIVIDATILGEKSEDQKENKHVYWQCKDYMWSDIHHDRSMECYDAHTSLRKYTVNVKTSNVNSPLKTQLTHWFEKIQSIYSDYYTHIEEITEKVEPTNMKMVVEYPMDREVVDMHLYTPVGEYDFDDIPLDNIYLTGFFKRYLPHNTQFSKAFWTMHHLGLTDTCFIDEDHIETVEDEHVKFHLPAEWTMYLGDAEKDAKHGVWAKNIEGTDKIAVKFMHGSHSLEIIPHGGKFDFIVDGKTITEETHSADWFHYQWMKDTDVVMVLTHHFGLYNVFDGHHLHMEIPQVDKEYYGRCGDNKA